MDTAPKSTQPPNGLHLRHILFQKNENDPSSWFAPLTFSFYLFLHSPFLGHLLRCPPVRSFIHSFIHKTFRTTAALNRFEHS